VSVCSDSKGLGGPAWELLISAYPP
jgi:hypothetical protein